MVLGAANPIGSEIEEAARSRFRCVGFFGANSCSLSVLKLSVLFVTIHRTPRIGLKSLRSFFSSTAVDLCS